VHSIFSTVSPIVDINSNIGGIAVALGGAIRNMSVTQNGTAGAGNDTLTGISINAYNINVSADRVSVSLPDYVSGSVLHGAVGLNSDADNTTISNYTCRGTTNPSVGGSRYANLNFGGANGTYYNIHVDSVKGGTEVAGRVFTASFV
jgi:hypothetical protein